MPHIELKTVEQLRWMREAGLVVASIHEALRAAVRPGITTRELDEVSAQAIADGGGASNFLGYYGYPATVCISVNDVIVHGIPGDYELAPGDIVSFDCGAFIERGGNSGTATPRSASSSASSSLRTRTSRLARAPLAQSPESTRTCSGNVANSMP